ncbi:MAG: hypothetical protein IT515_02860 [Burkholderiales bacterium]|nr:hypothetical protein [Burkholderiales bacterium]
MTASGELQPEAIIQWCDLSRPIYRKIAAHGDFDCEKPRFTWEAAHNAAAPRECAGLESAAA